MRIVNSKVYIDDVASFRTDGHSVTIFDPVGAVLVIPVNVLYELCDNVKETIDAKEKPVQVTKTP